jgi:MFS family permease
LAEVTTPSRRRTALRSVGKLATDITPLRVHRDFRLLWGGNLVSAVGRQLTVVALPYQVFELTHSSLAVGGLGLAQLIPLIVVSLAGGAIADRVDRRRLLLLTNILLAGCSTLLTVSTFQGWATVPFLYVMAMLIGGIAAIDQPTRMAMVPNLVPLPYLASAMSLNSMAAQLTFIVGPALAGVIIAALGTGPCYLIDVVTFGAVIAATMAIAPQPRVSQTRESMAQAIARGVAFTWRQAILRSSFLLDGAAVVFGLRRALFPVLGTVVYGAGAAAVGGLYSAQAVGALVAAGTGGWVGHTRRQGWIMIVTVGVWGLSVLGLGLANSFWLAALAVAVGGAADGYSVVARSTMVQTVTPDDLRGRVNAVYVMFAAAGNYTGDFEAGAVASATSPAFSILSGGVMVLLLLAALTAGFPQLRDYRARYLHEGSG